MAQDFSLEVLLSSEWIDQPGLNRIPSDGVDREISSRRCLLIAEVGIGFDLESTMSGSRF